MPITARIGFKTLIVGALSMGALTVSLFGCGGGGSDNSANERYLAADNGVYIKGMPYACGSNDGRTGDEGAFYSQSNQGCTFYLGQNEFTVSATTIADNTTIFLDDFNLTQDEQVALLAAVDAISHRSNLDANLVEVDPVLVGRVGKFESLNAQTIQGTLDASFHGSLGRVDTKEAERLLNRPVVSSSGTQKVTPYYNYVNFYIYDYKGDPMSVTSVTNNISQYSSADTSVGNLWIEPNQNPSNSSPTFCANNAQCCDKCTIYTTNVVGGVLYAGRHKTDQVANAFNSNLFILPTAAPVGTGTPEPTYPNNSGYGFGGPVTVYADSTGLTEENNSYYPQELNFGFRASLVITTTSNGVYTCPDMMLGQGSQSASLKAVLTFIKDLGETAYQAVQVVGEDGSDLKGDYDLGKDVVGLGQAAEDLASTNWWMVGQDNRYETYRMTATNGSYSVLINCFDSSNNTIPALVYQNADDHTLSLQIGVGQKIAVAPSAN